MYFGIWHCGLIVVNFVFELVIQKQNLKFRFRSVIRCDAATQYLSERIRLCCRVIQFWRYTVFEDINGVSFRMLPFMLIDQRFEAWGKIVVHYVKLCYSACHSRPSASESLPPIVCSHWVESGPRQEPGTRTRTMGDNRSHPLYWFRCNVKTSIRVITTHLFLVPVKVSVPSNVNTPLVRSSGWSRCALRFLHSCFLRP